MKSYKKVVTVLSLLFLTACDTEKNPPSNLLTKDALVPLMVDLHLAEAKVQNMNYHSVDSNMFVYLKLEELVFKKHNTTKAVYDSSYSFYSKNTQDFNLIYEKILDSLNIKNTKKTDL